MDYLQSFKQMISLRGLTDHTMKSYTTYISAYLDYVQKVLDKDPSSVSYAEMRGFLSWIQTVFYRGSTPYTYMHLLAF